MLCTIAQSLLGAVSIHFFVPIAYFGLIPLGLIPLVALIGGIIATPEPNRYRLLKRLCGSIGAAHLLILAATIFAGGVSIADIQVLNAFLQGFVALQGAYALVVVAQFRRHVLAVFGIMAFAVVYSVAAASVAGMVFTNSGM